MSETVTVDVDLLEDLAEELEYGNTEDVIKRLRGLTQPVQQDDIETEVAQDFAQAFEDPDNFDFGHEERRAETGFANFGFDPDEAQRLQNEQLDRIRKNEGEAGVQRQAEGYSNSRLTPSGRQTDPE